MLSPGPALAGDPVLLGFDGELSVEGSTSAQAIQAGIEIAIDEINAAGGVLGGRPLALVVRDNRTMPARSAQNLREFAAMPALVGVFCGRYSPTVLETLPLVHALGLPLLDPWASADGVIAHGMRPSYTFRLSMSDSWAMPVICNHAMRQGRRALGMLAVNTSWGRSSEQALMAHLSTRRDRVRLAAARWYNYTDSPAVFAVKYQELVQAGAEAIVFIGNFREGAELVHAIAALPASERRPVLAHAGVMGGDFGAACGDALQRVQVDVVQTFGFAGATRPSAARVRTAALKRLAPGGRDVPSAAGLAQAYDLMHITARAISAGRSAERAALRDALERSAPYAGLIRYYPAPFTPARHDALRPGDLYMARFNSDGTLLRAR
ncbi:MAG: ABC transporter substrate-binding protein [Pseudomonadota bacterium]